MAQMKKLNVYFRVVMENKITKLYRMIFSDLIES
jgi:hypothetical protein